MTLDSAEFRVVANVTELLFVPVDELLG